MRRPADLPPELAERQAFSVEHARRLGVSTSRLRAGDLTAVYRGARLATGEPSPHDLAAAFAARMTERQFFSHATAAVLHGVPLPRGLEVDRRLHVSVLAGGPRPRVRGVIGHVVDPQRTRTTLVRGMRVTDAATTWCQLGAMLDADDLVAAGDFLLTGRAPVRDRGPLTTIHALAAALDAHGGTVGVARLREAFPLVRRGPLSRRETLLRLRIVRAGLPEPVVNMRIPEARHDGYVPMIDLGYPRYRVGIEYEGDHHRSTAQFRRDIRRYERLQDVGWSIVRVSGDDIGEADGDRRSREVIGRIAARLRARGWCS